MQSASEDSSPHDNVIEREGPEIVWNDFSYEIRRHVAVICEDIAYPFRVVLN